MTLVDHRCEHCNRRALVRATTCLIELRPGQDDCLAPCRACGRVSRHPALDLETVAALVMAGAIAVAADRITEGEADDFARRLEVLGDDVVGALEAET